MNADRRSLNVGRVFALAGGPTALRRLLAAHNPGGEDAVPALTVINMWKSRGRIAGEWVAEVVALVLAQNPPLTFGDLLEREPDFADNPGGLFSTPGRR